MSKIEALIQKLCPDGVPSVKFEDSCEYIRGITYNKSNEVNDTSASSWKVLRANNITLQNNRLNFEDVKRVSKDVKVKPTQTLKKGDILICAGSGSKDHIGKVAYIFEDMDYAFGGFMAVIRSKSVNSRFLFHILTSNSFKQYLGFALNSTTINNLNASVMAGFEFPLPPLAVQEEVVRILDKFSALEAELEAELEARKKQYEHYRNHLLDFNDNPNVKWAKLGEVGSFVRGNGLQKKDFTEKGIGCIHYGQIYTRLGTFTDKTLTYCPEEIAKKLTPVHPGNLIIACTSENVEDVCKSVVWLGDEDIVTGGHACVFSHNENPKYIAYLFQTENFFLQKKKYARGVKVIDIKITDLEKITVPIPPLVEQNRIVEILDRFEALTTSLQEGLPAEIAARRKQYEHYRDRLLEFKN